jgi:hypothetical protein
MRLRPFCQLGPPCAAALTIGSRMSASPIPGLMFLLLAAGAASAEDPSGDKGLATYAIAMHGQPALPADFSRLPYAIRRRRKEAIWRSPTKGRSTASILIT